MVRPGTVSRSAVGKLSESRNWFQEPSYSPVGLYIEASLFEGFAFQ